MARTFNRRPMSVGTPSSSDVKQYFFNHCNWKGINQNRNFLLVDQETFADAKNVYVDEEGLLKSRPPITLKHKFEKNGSMTKFIKDFKVFGDIVVCTYIGADGEWYIGIIDNEVWSVDYKIYSDYPLKAFRNGNYVYIFTNSGVLSYDSNSETPAIVEANIYYPIRRIYTSGNYEFYEDDNLISNKIRYQYLLYPTSPYKNDDGTHLSSNMLNSNAIGKTANYVHYINEEKISHNVYIDNDGDYLSIIHQPITYDTSGYITENAHGVTVPLVLIMNNFIFKYDKNNYTLLRASTGDLVFETIWRCPTNNDNFVKIKEQDGFMSIIYKDIIYNIYPSGDLAPSLELTDLGGISLADYDREYVDVSYKFIEGTLRGDFVIIYLIRDESNTIIGKQVAILTHLGMVIANDDLYENSHQTFYLGYEYHSNDKFIVHADVSLNTLDNSNRRGSLFHTISIQLKIHKINIVDVLTVDGTVRVGNQFLQSYNTHHGSYTPVENISTEIEYFNNLSPDFNSLPVANSIVDYNYPGNKKFEAFISFLVSDGTSLFEYGDVEKYLDGHLDLSHSYAPKSQYLHSAAYNGKLFIDYSDTSEHSLYLISDDYSEKLITNFDGKLVLNRYSPYWFYLLESNSVVLSNYRVVTTELNVYLNKYDYLKDFDLLVKGNKIYASKGSTLYIGDIIVDPDDELEKLYFRKVNLHTLDGNVKGLHQISDNELAIFTDDDTWYNTLLDGVYHYKRSKIVPVLKDYSNLITLPDSTTTLMPSKDGIVALSYQNFVNTTEQSTLNITSDLDALYKNFTSSIRNLNWKYYTLFYQKDSKMILLYDNRLHSWWKWTAPKSVTTLFVYDNKLYFICRGSIYELNETTTNYKDDDEKIEWFIESQKLHLNANNYYKHISNITLSSVEEGDTKLSLNLNVKNYRKWVDNGKAENFDYSVDVIRTYIKRVNYAKVCEFQYRLSSDDTQAKNVPLALSNITIKYKIGGQVR